MNEPLNIEQDRKNRDKIKISGRGAVGSARGSGLRGRQFKSGRPDHVYFSGLSAVVARTSGGREVASSILVAPTIRLILVLEIIRLFLRTGGTSQGVNASSILVAPTTQGG